MAATTRAVPLAEESELVLTRVFDAPRSLVFKAWTQPEHLARWWGPQGFVNVAWEMDVRPGGGPLRDRPGKTRELRARANRRLTGSSARGI